MASRYERYQYIYGNTVRAEEAVMPEPNQPEEQVRQPEKKKQATGNRKVLDFNRSFTKSLSIAVAAVVIICISYLHGQHQLNNRIREISAKQTELATLISENHARKSNLDKVVDYDEIREYAKEKLGMVTPGEKNTIYYDGAASDYVRQYEDIPSAQ